MASGLKDGFCHLFVRLFIRLFIRSFLSFVCLFVRPFVRLSVCLFLSHILIVQRTDEIIVISGYLKQKHLSIMFHAAHQHHIALHKRSSLHRFNIKALIHTDV